jgi:hypothetical protein
MLRCNLEEIEDATMAQFFAGLNREIQDILEYKDYTNITCLFHFACKADREVQGCHASAKTNFSTGRTNSWQHNIGRTAPPSLSPSRAPPSTSNNSSKPRAAATNSATRAPQQQRVPHHPLSLLHLQADRETSNVTAVKGLDMLCVIAPPCVFWL